MSLLLLWIELIIRLRDTGMPLAQIRHFANLRRIGPQTTKERRMILEDHRHILAKQMKQLMQHLDALADETDCRTKAVISRTRKTLPLVVKSSTKRHCTYGIFGDAKHEKRRNFTSNVARVEPRHRSLH